LAIIHELHARLGIAGLITIVEDMIMRKVVSTTLAGALLFGLSLGMVGCSEETGSKEKVEVTTPGGKSTVERNVTVKQSGDNPPPVSPDAAKP
jgi:hypothetical protein